MDSDSIDQWLVGIVRAPISCLYFPPNGVLPRLIVQRNRNQKERLFRSAALCKPHIYENQILVEVDSETRRQILTALRLSSDQLKDPTSVKHLPPNFQLRCTDGRQRVDAARRLWGHSFEWTIRLYYAGEPGL